MSRRSFKQCFGLSTKCQSYMRRICLRSLHSFQLISSTVKTMFAQDDSRSIFDVPLACWIQLCFVRLHRNKMTVITSETIVLYFNLIAHWQSYTQKRILNFEKKICCSRVLKYWKQRQLSGMLFPQIEKTRRVAVLSVLYTFTKI